MSTDSLIPTRKDLEERLPAEYRRYAGIGPYYLPVFGRVYLKRLRDGLDAVHRHVHCPLSVLDVGCGFGVAGAAMADMFPQTQVVGLDVYPDRVLQYASTVVPGAQRVTFVSGSIEDPPVKDHRFSLITAFDVLEHVSDPIRAIDQIVKMLDDDGLVIISVPIESPFLRAIRNVALVGGSLGDNHPHWEGTCRSLSEFEDCCRERLDMIEVFNTPFRFAPRLFNYDVIFVGRTRSAR